MDGKKKKTTAKLFVIKLLCFSADKLRVCFVLFLFFFFEVAWSLDQIDYICRWWNVIFFVFYFKTTKYISEQQSNKQTNKREKKTTNKNGKKTEYRTYRSIKEIRNKTKSQISPVWCMVLQNLRTKNTKNHRFFTFYNLNQTWIRFAFVGSVYIK